MPLVTPVQSVTKRAKITCRYVFWYMPRLYVYVPRYILVSNLPQRTYLPQHYFWQHVTSDFRRYKVGVHNIQPQTQRNSLNSFNRHFVLWESVCKKMSLWPGGYRICLLRFAEGSVAQRLQIRQRRRWQTNHSASKRCHLVSKPTTR